MSNQVEMKQFAAVCSEDYIEHLAGLILNLGKIYKNFILYVVALDHKTSETFRDSSHVTILCVEDVWGKSKLQNLRQRCDLRELAFATKSALISHVLELYEERVLLIDVDLVFFDQIDDLFEQLDESDILLVPTRHGYDRIERTKISGLFSAGMVGFTRKRLQAVKLWQQYCFEKCMLLPIAGLYYEQKYLDYLVANYPAAIIHDDGINVGGYHLSRTTVEKRDGGYYFPNGTKLRAFHVNRATSRKWEFAQAKLVYNQEAMKDLGLITSSKVSTLSKPKKGWVINIKKLINFDKAQEYVQGLFVKVYVIFRKAQRLSHYIR